MAIWIIFASMTGAAVLALLWPLGRGGASGFAELADARSLYKAQLAEIGRDVARGLIGPDEAEAARGEAGRRLLRAAREPEAATGETEASLRRRRASSALALSCVPLLALLIYGAQGSPHLPDQPLAARLSDGGAHSDMSLALARIESHLAANPADARGWAVVAPVYLRLGRHDDAVRAFSAALSQGEASAELLAGLGEARTLAAGGIVTSEARESLSRALVLDPGNVRARYFLALASEQDGDLPAAATALRALLADAPPDAGWAEPVRERLKGLDAAASRGAIAAMPEAERQAAIRGMVEGLAARLEAQGGTAEDWQRLVRARMVLGDRPAALAALAEARRKLAQDAQALASLDVLAREFALPEAQP